MTQESMMRNLPLWLIFSVIGFFASGVSAIYGARLFKRSKTMTRIMDPHVARAHLQQLIHRTAALMSITVFVIYMLVGLLILLVQPDSLGQSVLGALVAGVSSFIGYWIGFFIYDRLHLE